MADKRHQRVSKLLWVDLEMTGLEVEKEVVIEIAAIVTDMKFKPLGQYHTIINQPQEYIDAMDKWNTEHHGKSGLTAKIPNGLPPEVVDQEMSEFIKKHFKDPAILAGNSISQDRKFIKAYFPKMDALLHYRLLDITAFKVIFENNYNKVFDKTESHRALDDIQESIGELKYYLSFIN